MTFVGSATSNSGSNKGELSVPVPKRWKYYPPTGKHKTSAEWAEEVARREDVAGEREEKDEGRRSCSVTQTQKERWPMSALQTRNRSEVRKARGVFTSVSMSLRIMRKSQQQHAKDNRVRHGWKQHHESLVTTGTIHTYLQYFAGRKL